jgi:hypothetical protein
MTKQVNLAEYMAFIKAQISYIYTEVISTYNISIEAYIVYKYPSKDTINMRYIPIADSREYQESILVYTLDNKILISLEM